MRRPCRQHMWFFEFQNSNFQTSSEIRHPKGPIGYKKKATIWKEARVVHVGAVMQYARISRGGSNLIKKVQSACNTWKDCQSHSTSFNTDNVDFLHAESRVARTSARRLRHPAWRFLFLKPLARVLFHPGLINIQVVRLQVLKFVT